MPEIPVTVTYQGVVITYAEARNVWLFQLRDRDREAATLAAAKAAIDRPPKVKNAFKRVDAWSNGSYAGATTRFEAVEITSLTANGMVNFVFKEKNPNRISTREQTWPKYVYPQNADNDALIAEHTKVLDEYKALGKKLAAIVSKLQCYVAPDED